MFYLLNLPWISFSTESILATDRCSQEPDSLLSWHCGKVGADRIMEQVRDVYDMTADTAPTEQLSPSTKTGISMTWRRTSHWYRVIHQSQVCSLVLWCATPNLSRTLISSCTDISPSTFSSRSYSPGFAVHWKPGHRLVTVRWICVAYRQAAGLPVGLVREATYAARTELSSIFVRCVALRGKLLACTAYTRSKGFVLAVTSRNSPELSRTCRNSLTHYGTHS